MDGQAFDKALKKTSTVLIFFAKILKVPFVNLQDKSRTTALM